MKRIYLTLLYSFLYIVIASATSFAMGFSRFDQFWSCFWFGVAIFAVSFITFLFIRHKRRLKLIPFFMNGVALGVFLQSWYIYKQIQVPLWAYSMDCAIEVLFFAFFLLLAKIPAFEKRYHLFLLIFSLFVMVGCIVILYFFSESWISTLGYLGIAMLSFMLAIGIHGESDHLLYNTIVVGSYSVFICALVLLTILFGGKGVAATVSDFDGVSSPFAQVKKN